MRLVLGTMVPLLVFSCLVRNVESYATSKRLDIRGNSLVCRNSRYEPGPQQQSRWWEEREPQYDDIHSYQDPSREDYWQYQESPPPRSAPLDRPGPRYREEDVQQRKQRRSYEQVEEDEDDSAAGNFWSNPVREESTRVSRPRAERPGPPRRRRFQSGSPPPAAATDFYNRLFWYGVDGDGEDMDGRDRTVFGGTRGKFNGLSFFQEPERPPPRRPRRNGADRPPDRPRRGRREYPGETPPYDPPNPGTRDRGARRSPQRNDDWPSERGARPSPRRNDDWVSEQVSSWFDPEFDRPPPPRRQRPGDWRGVFDTFLGIDRHELEDQARTYDRKMGLRRDHDDEDDFEEPRRRKRERENVVVDTKSTVDHEVPDETNDSKKPVGGSTQRLSWEERAMAVDRVPPANVRAWGPNGEMGVDARTKALSDALEDIEYTKAVIEERQQKVFHIREDISVFRVDAELERKQLRSDPDLTPMQRNEILRQMDRRLDEMGRALRYQEMMLEMGHEDLEELEARHWGILNVYGPDTAKKPDVETDESKATTKTPKATDATIVEKKITEKQEVSETSKA